MDSIPVRLVRRASTSQVLGVAWHGGTLCADDVMEHTGFTRSTTLQALGALIDLGLMEESTATGEAGNRGTGRPARWFRIRAEAGVLVGLEAGHRSMSVVVTDLLGEVRARRSVGIPDPEPSFRQDTTVRRRLAMAAVADALRGLELGPGDVVGLGIGVPAPVDDQGCSPEGQRGFWRVMHADLLESFRQDYRCVRMENDAALAALAERHFGAARGQRNFVTLLAAWGLGAGVVLDGHLVRGARGGVGELGFLDRVPGVGGSQGVHEVVEKFIRSHWRADQLAEGHPWREFLEDRRPRESLLADLNANDPVTAPLFHALADRFANLFTLLATVYDPARIIVAGPVAGDIEDILEAARQRRRRDTGMPAPEIVASSLGHDVVPLGAAAAARELAMSEVIEWALIRRNLTQRPTQDEAATPPRAGSVP